MANAVPEADGSHAHLYEIPVASCGLTEGTIYHYCFEVTDTNVYGAAPTRIRVTDPTEMAVSVAMSPPLEVDDLVPDIQKVLL